MKTIYAISSGSYSDYRVLAVCEDEATAEAWAKALREEPDGWRTDANVESMLMLEAGEPVIKRHCVDLRQELSDNGTERPYNVSESDEYEIGSIQDAPPKRPSVRFVRAPMHNGKGGRLEITGQTLKAVMKVYSEQYAVWKSLPQAFGRAVSK